jgi:hypothetical protein
LNKRDLLNQEIQRLAREDLRFGQAILDFYDAPAVRGRAQAHARTKARALGGQPDK